MIGGAVTGKWKTALPETAIEEIESAWGGLMANLGYELMFPKKDADLDFNLRKHAEQHLQ